MKLGLVLGNCLFEKKLPCDKYFMAEDYSLCTHFKYHKHKLILFLSSMRSYADKLGKNCIYYKLDEKPKLSYEQKLLETIKKTGTNELVTYTIEDKFFRDRIEKFCKSKSIKLTVLDSPGFVTTIEQFSKWYLGKRKIMAQFYTWQRKRLKIMVDEVDAPTGGKWSYDVKNRLRIPKGLKIPVVVKPNWTKHTREVMKLVDKTFADHPGASADFWLATTREDARLCMQDFFEKRFANFGPYEDAIKSDETFLFHSTLSAYLNIGLLTPAEVVNYALAIDAPIESKEGFIRQIIGWREFIRGMYNCVNFRGNHFGHKNKLETSWYNATTGIEPLDCVIKRVGKYGYCHHIERLMVVGNLMLLKRIDPDEVYRWFMEMFVDSADWVMEPNVYGMSQYADGGIFATKPYICASAYILRMSDFKRGSWCPIVDKLYWDFIEDNSEEFRKNPRMAMMVRISQKRKK